MEITWTQRIIGLLYLAVAGLCFCTWHQQSSQAAIHSSTPAVHPSPTPWLVAAVGILALGLNDQLRLQMRLTNIVRKTARSEGWYHPWRRRLQIILTTISILIAGAMLWGSFALLQNSDGSSRLATGALIYLIGLVLVRAPSMHEIDRLLYRPRKRLANLRLITILETTGLLTIALAGILALLDAPLLKSRSGM